ncbi:MAG TPA: tetratricopeptide repeat protein, partial [Methanoregulaceae archaeon]|nr:tetratricopeptide repeat protein [Methanoregulaceae archaeon]
MEPNDPVYWKQRAMDCYNDDKIEEARECWINALDLDPDDIVVWKLLRNASHDAGDVNGAEFCSEKIRELEKKNAAEPDSIPLPP